jgi:membrane protein DedA with SNARE-associated domain
MPLESTSRTSGASVVSIAAALDWQFEAAQAKPEVAVAAVFVLAFGESLAFMSLIFPATFALVAVGGLIGSGAVSFFPSWLAAAVGAALGDWLSFWLGRRYREAIWGLWPLSRHPKLRTKSATFLAQWGAIGVFASKFWGPLRASVPITAGLGGLPNLPFQIVNWTSAAIWSFLLLAPGAFGVEALRRWTS